MPLKIILRYPQQRTNKSLTMSFRQDLPAFLLTDQLGTCYAVSLWEEDRGASGSNGEAERVSENLSDAQCYKKKKKREGWREGKERDRGRERGENKKKFKAQFAWHGFSKFHLSLELLLWLWAMPTGCIYFSLPEVSFQSVTPAWSPTSLLDARHSGGSSLVEASCLPGWNVDSSKRKDASRLVSRSSEHEEAIETSSAKGC